MSKYFRFEDLEIWKESISIAIELCHIANELEEKKLWRFCDQTRGVAMSIPNNIAESTGSNLAGEQRMSLRIARKECFEAANILVILELERLIHPQLKSTLYKRLSGLCKGIQAYSVSLS